MKLFDILKQFKNIEPDAQFIQRSKRDILLSPRSQRRTVRGIFAFLHVIETSAAVVLAGLFILVLTGSFSGPSSISPIQYSVIDPEGLHAEAEAVDMQIQLANVDYPQATATGNAIAESTVASGTPMKTFAAAAALPTSQISSSSNVMEPAETSSTSSSSSVSVDDALKALSQ